MTWYNDTSKREMVQALDRSMNVTTFTGAAPSQGSGSL